LQSLFFLGSTNPYKEWWWSTTKIFLRTLCFICKGYRPLSTCEKNWLCWFILCQFLHVEFPSHSFLVEHELPVVVTKTMEFHVLPHWSYCFCWSTNLQLLFLLVLIFGCLEVALTHLLWSLIIWIKFEHVLSMLLLGYLKCMKSNHAMALQF